MYELFLVLSGAFIGYSLLCIILGAISRLKKDILDTESSMIVLSFIFFALFAISLIIASKIGSI